jgi:hypothetical protein
MTGTRWREVSCNENSNDDWWKTEKTVQRSGTAWAVKEQVIRPNACLCSERRTRQLRQNAVFESFWGSKWCLVCLMRTSLPRDSQSIRSGKEWPKEWLQSKPCRSFVFVNLEQRLRNVWRSKRYVQQFGRSWWRGQVSVLRHRENAHALDINLIVSRTSGHPKYSERNFWLIHFDD